MRLTLFTKGAYNMSFPNPFGVVKFNSATSNEVLNLKQTLYLSHTWGIEKPNTSNLATSMSASSLFYEIYQIFAQGVLRSTYRNVYDMR